jgi:hypothetical protein
MARSLGSRESGNNAVAVVRTAPEIVARRMYGPELRHSVIWAWGPAPGRGGHVERKSWALSGDVTNVHTLAAEATIVLPEFFTELLGKLGQGWAMARCRRAVGCAG